MARSEGNDFGNRSRFQLTLYNHVTTEQGILGTARVQDRGSGDDRTQDDNKPLHNSLLGALHNKK